MTKCPKCQQEGAYVGVTVVECPNPLCSHFTYRQLEEWNKEKITTPSEHDFYPERPQHIWITHHHDFGD